jgi:hypothetical protein
MGIHHWTGYVNEDAHCIRAFKTLVDEFCTGCHTSEDVGGCSRCEIGRANDMMRKYLLESNSYPEIQKKKCWKDFVKYLKEFDKDNPEYKYLRILGNKSGLTKEEKQKYKKMDPLRKVQFVNTCHWKRVEKLHNDVLKEIEIYYKKLGF